MQVSNLFIYLAQSVLEGKTENIDRRLDYSASLLGKHKRTSIFVELSGQNIKWIFIINITTFLLQCITKTRITTCTIQLSVHTKIQFFFDILTEKQDSNLLGIFI